ncbi:hypothetical protein CFP56_015309 [Quercus suber]|uniref:Uncharacterized protein n=1 Tax=Quercus suber TaxID=58331 RepID=A0AAW0M3N1_QUESU
MLLEFLLRLVSFITLDTYIFTQTTTVLSTCFAFVPIPSLNSLKFQFPSCIPWTSDDDDKEALLLSPAASKSDSSSSQLDNEKVAWVTREDADHLCRLVEEKDAGPAWIQMMDRSTSTMSYQAWRRDPETGPPQYRSRTVYEDATPELVRDFFWDDEF